MAKLTKKELKQVLKECIREIFKEEGIVLAEGATATAIKNNRIAAPETVYHEQQETEAPIQNSRLMETVNSIANSFSVKGDKEADLFRSILADTAATTLQEQQGAGHSVGQQGSSGLISELATASIPVSSQQVQSDRSELSSLSHGGDISRWAKVAFAGKGKN